MLRFVRRIFLKEQERQIITREYVCISERIRLKKLIHQIIENQASIHQDDSKFEIKIFLGSKTLRNIVSLFKLKMIRIPCDQRVCMAYFFNNETSLRWQIT